MAETWTIPMMCSEI